MSAISAIPSSLWYVLSIHYHFSEKPLEMPAEHFDVLIIGAGLSGIGAAAHLTRPGHKIIVASFGAYDESDLERYSPVVVHVNDDNAIVAVDSHPEVLLAGPEAVS